MAATASARRCIALCYTRTPEQIGLPCNCASQLLPPVHCRCACCSDLPQAAGPADCSLLLLVLLLQQLPLQRLQACNVQHNAVNAAAGLKPAASKRHNHRHPLDKTGSNAGSQCCLTCTLRWAADCAAALVAACCCRNAALLSAMPSLASCAA